MADMAHIATWDADARKRLAAATDELARRMGLPGVDLENRRGRDPLPTPKSVGDLELVALLAEAVARMGERLDRLEAETGAAAIARR